MKNVVKMLFCLFVFSSCGSAKKVVKQSIDQTSTETYSNTVQGTADVNVSTGLSSAIEAATYEQTEDSTATLVIKKTLWFDTSHCDSLGVTPVLREETVTSLTCHGKRTNKGSKDKSNAEGKSNSFATINYSANKEESAVSTNRCKTEVAKSLAETKQLAYTSWMLYGLAACILMAILAYWVFTKYRARHNE